MYSSYTFFSLWTLLFMPSLLGCLPNRRLPQKYASCNSLNGFMGANKLKQTRSRVSPRKQKQWVCVRLLNHPDGEVRRYCSTCRKLPTNASWMPHVHTRAQGAASRCADSYLPRFSGLSTSKVCFQHQQVATDLLSHTAPSHHSSSRIASCSAKHGGSNRRRLPSPTKQNYGASSLRPVFSRWLSPYYVTCSRHH